MVEHEGWSCACLAPHSIRFTGDNVLLLLLLGVVREFRGLVSVAVYRLFAPHDSSRAASSRLC